MYADLAQARRQEENCTRRYSEKLSNQNGEHIVNLCESNYFETQA